MKKFLCWAVLALTVGGVVAEMADAARRVRRVGRKVVVVAPATVIVRGR